MINIKIHFSHTYNKNRFYHVWHYNYQLGTLTDELGDGWRFLPSPSSKPALRYLYYDNLSEAIEKLPSHLNHWLAEYAVHILHESLVKND